MPVLKLQERHLRKLDELLEQYVPEAEVWGYGSRINGEAHETSDLDLVVRNPINLSSSVTGINILRDALSESNIPILIDVLDWSELPENFHTEIEKSMWLLRIKAI